MRAPHLMLGYWRNDEATLEAFTPDGWYSPGDLATLDEDGIVTFLDRKRDLIISGGLNIYPSEVERVIAEHPGVREVAVVGAPDEEWGEAVVAYVVPGRRRADRRRDHRLDARAPRRLQEAEARRVPGDAAARLVEQGAEEGAARPAVGRPRPARVKGARVTDIALYWQRS